MKKEVESSASASNKEIQIEIGANEVEKEWLSLVNEKGKHKIKTWKIQKVPWILRENKANTKDYDPLVVSIGPYHHGKPELQFVENLKFKVAWHYANNEQPILQQLYTKVKNVAKDAREFYKDDDEQSVSKLDDREFTQMMFLDGCFVLQFIESFAKDEHGQLDMKDNIAVCVSRDLFLLENQLPFLVLFELIRLRKEIGEWEKMLRKFLEKTKTGLPYKDNSKKSTCTPQRNCGQDQHHIKRKVKDDSSTLLEIIRTWLVGEEGLTKKEEGLTKKEGDRWASYRSAKELKAVGIHFNPSKSGRLIDVKFKSLFFAAILYLPPITVDDSTKSMLLNMVAYEACPGGPDDFGVSSYICFLDSLIDHAEDVKELRSEGILKNLLGSDQQVADLFNEIADNLVANHHAYATVKNRIEKHYKNKIKNWLAEFWFTHFTSPWTCLAFLGAALALALSVIQTFPSLISKEH